MQITLAQPELLEHLEKKGCTQPNQCYANCARIVYSLQVGNYVLCKITDANGRKHGHAIIGFNNNFFDPTLQKNSKLATHYEHIRTFTRDELIAFMKNEGGQFGDDGYEGWPPALMADDSIQCIEVPLGA